MSRQPCFDNILKILHRQKPDRPTLFEFFLNTKLYEELANEKFTTGDFSSQYDIVIRAFVNAGYDYATLRGSEFNFPLKEHDRQKTISLNNSSLISDRNEFNHYKWPDPYSYDYSRLEKCKDVLPAGMKIIVWGPGGVLENAMDLIGYDNLCYMLGEDPELVADVFEAVGTRLIQYYQICAGFDSVGALISNDDWGFATQTLLSPGDLRKYVFPYHKRIVETIHAAGKPAILHSCGNLTTVMDDIIDDMKYDGKHSYEDNILPVEEAYQEYHDRIAVLGGIDLDFICRSTPEAIITRCRRMIELTDHCKGYALGTGNSVPDYVPFENYYAMIGTIR